VEEEGHMRLHTQRRHVICRVEEKEGSSLHTQRRRHAVCRVEEKEGHTSAHTEKEGRTGGGRGATARIAARRRERRTDEGGLKTMVSLLLPHLRWSLGFLRGYNFYYIITIHARVSQRFSFTTLFAGVYASSTNLHNPL
jgi:hypothetical protein